MEEVDGSEDREFCEDHHPGRRLVLVVVLAVERVPKEWEPTLIEKVSSQEEPTH